MIRSFFVDFVIVCALCSVVWGSVPVWGGGCTPKPQECPTNKYGTCLFEGGGGGPGFSRTCKTFLGCFCS